MKRELATLPADLPHVFHGPNELCDICGRQVGAELHRELVIEKATAPPGLVREKGV